MTRMKYLSAEELKRLTEQMLDEINEDRHAPVQDDLSSSGETLKPGVPFHCFTC